MSYLGEVIAYAYHVPTIHHHQEPSSGKTPQEDFSLFTEDGILSLPCLPIIQGDTSTHGPIMSSQ